MYTEPREACTCNEVILSFELNYYSNAQRPKTAKNSYIVSNLFSCMRQHVSHFHAIEIRRALSLPVSFKLRHSFAIHLLYRYCLCSKPQMRCRRKVGSAGFKQVNLPMRCSPVTAVYQLIESPSACFWSDFRWSHLLSGLATSDALLLYGFRYLACSGFLWGVDKTKLQKCTMDEHRRQNKRKGVVTY